MTAKNGHLITGSGKDFSYISFGSGKKDLVMIPGLGDGLVTVKGKACLGPLMFSFLSRKYRITMISRRNDLPIGSTTETMADDKAEAMEALGIVKAHIVGVSQGGMILQHLAAGYPELVDKMILCVTCPVSNPIINDNLRRWKDMAGKKDFRSLMLDINLKSHTEDMEKKLRRQACMFSMMPKPRSYERFFIQADACSSHDARSVLSGIKAPTLIIGGEKDVTLGPDPSRELHEAIRGSELYMYPGYGHALYENAPDFMERVDDSFRA